MSPCLEGGRSGYTNDVAMHTGWPPVIGAMTGGLAAAQRREREGAREGILGDLETAHPLELALTQPGNERASGWLNHLTVYIQSEMAQIKWLPRKRK